MLMIMDASFNVAMEPFRALVADKLPTEQRTLGFSVQTCLIGIGAVIKAFSPTTRVIGAAARSSQALALSMKAGHVVDCDHDDTLADAVAGGIDEDTLTLPLAQAVVDEVVSCSEAEILSALRGLAQTENLLVEGAAALAMAAYRKLGDATQGKINVVLLCGGNFDGPKLRALALG